MSFFKSFFFFPFCLFTQIILAQNIVVNEVVSSNSSIITDEDGSFEDWIELYNPSSEAINLEGFGLSDNDNFFKWVFPNKILEPNTYLLIWCSNKNRTNPDFPLHTNFAISAGGETLTLTAPNGTIVSQVPAVVIPSNYSYGLNAMNAYSFFTIPTPGAINDTPSYDEILSEPVFSMNSGFYDESFMLSISHPDPTVSIIYTLDGSEPRQENLNGTTYQYKTAYKEFAGSPQGTLVQNTIQTFNYAESILLQDRNAEPNKLAMIPTAFYANQYYIPTISVDKATVVRAKAIKAGALSSKTITRNYFINENGNSSYSLPVVSISMDESSFFDYENGIYVPGKDFDDWRQIDPTGEAVWGPANYKRSGEEWEVRGNFSFLLDGNEVLNHDIGVRMHGGYTRSFPSKTLRLYARSEYGSSHLNFPFFEEVSSTSFKRIILRNSGNDHYSTYFRDAFIQKSVNHLKFDTQAYQPSVVFLNGEYWGMLNLRERYDKHYFERVYGIDETELDFLEADGMVKEGDNVHYMNMLDFVENNSLSNESNYAYIQTQMDVENFIDYYATQIYVRNTDWPGNNIEFFRKKTSEYLPNAPLGQDGRWRWILKDTDFGFGGEGEASAHLHNTLSFATAENGPAWPNPAWSTFLFRKLLENEEFKIQFINRIADLMNSTFMPARLNQLIDEMKSQIEPEISKHRQRWSLGSLTQWNNHVQIMKDFANQRSWSQRIHIRQQFGISNNINVTLSVSDDNHGFIQMNTIEILETTPGINANPYPWTGTYFNQIPLKIKAVAKPGFEFSHWSGHSNSTEQEITITPNSSFSLTANFVPSSEPLPTETLYFWLMDNNIANDTPLLDINSTFQWSENGSAQLFFDSCLEGYPFASNHPNWRKASMERRNSPTHINYRPEANNDIPFENVSMRAIQIKQPFQNNDLENMMRFHVSSQSYKNIKFAFAAKDEGAADTIMVEYALDANEPTWTPINTFSLSDEYQVFESDLSGILEANNNPDLAFRIKFDGTNMTADNGNRVTFNNISVEGVLDDLSVENPIAQDIFLYPNPFEDFVYLNNSNQVYDYQLFSMEGKMIQSGKMQEGKLDLRNLFRGIYVLQLTNQDFTKAFKIVKS